MFKMCRPNESDDEIGSAENGPLALTNSSPNDNNEKEETRNKQRKENAFEAASLFSRLFFLWPYPLLKLGLERTLTDHDLPEHPQRESSAYCMNYFERIWSEEKQLHPQSPSLRRAITKDYFKSLWYAQPLMCASAVAKVVQALVLGKLIEFFQRGPTNDGNDNEGYVWAGILVACGLVILFELHHLFFYTWRKGSQIRVSCIAAIYDKCLKLSSIQQNTSTSYGRIMNLASNDAERFLLASLFINHMIWGPILAIAILVVGCTFLGAAFAAGFALLVTIFIPVQMYLGGMFAHYRSRIAALTDRRVTFVSQGVRGARVMKMSGYEDRFLERIMTYRADEITKIMQANNLKAWNEALFFVTNVVISLVIYVVHVKTGNVLTEGDVFTVFTLINILQLELMKHVSLGVMGVSECYVSTGRIQEFLEFAELAITEDEDVVVDEDSKVAIALENVTSYWNEIDDSDETAGSKNGKTDDLSVTDINSTRLVEALNSVSVDFHMNTLTAVIGSVGSGKSAVLQALVKELPIAEGKLCRQKGTTLAYAAQDPWIMDGTVKENILMGREFDDSWYRQVVKACGLVLDFRQLSDGDQTILGDRGVQCSGGQRARVGLARAIYRDADILIADDPLSAVDSKVGRQIYQEALLDLSVNRGKCVILATHQHQYVHDCRCVLVERGRVECIGSYTDCVQASNGKLSAHAADDAIVDVVESDEENHDMPSGTQDHSNEQVDKNDAVQNEGSKRFDDQKEMNREGTVEYGTYLEYLRAMGGVWVGIFLVLLFSATQGSVLVAIANVGRWAERPPEEQGDGDIIGLALGFGCIVVVLALLRAFLCFHLFIKASQRLHDQMANAVLRAKVQFFDTNPLGRILNRFSADVGITDDMLPLTLFDFFVLSFLVVGAIATTVSTLPFVFIALPFLFWYFLNVRNTFVTSSRELKRLEGLARSPIFAMLSESLGGIATIRANDSIHFFKKKFEDVHDAHTRAFFAFIAASRWVGFRMDSLVFVFLAAVSFLSVLFHEKGWFNVDPSILGLALSLLLQLAGVFQWCIRQSAEVVNQMVSVERVLAFGNVEPEAPLQKDGDKELLGGGWPAQGAIQVTDLSLRYRDSLPLALDKVTFSVPQGARVGIVGRTGSGKSTIVQALFRLLEAETGHIMIDGVDVSKLGLHALRTNMSIIPQSPTLYSGCSVRENLDMFGFHSDEALHAVLKACHLTHVIDELPGGLDSMVSDSGSNFSVGQRQLLCLARAILNKNRILVLDEATANVDKRTDQLLQETLRESFQGGTIIAVAHRLDTIIDFDLCLVLGSGKVLEFGSPEELIRADGIFASMVADTGESMANDLKRRAIQNKKNVA